MRGFGELVIIFSSLKKIKKMKKKKNMSKNFHTHVLSLLYFYYYYYYFQIRSVILFSTYLYFGHGTFVSFNISRHQFQGNAIS